MLKQTVIGVVTNCNKINSNSTLWAIVFFVSRLSHIYTNLVAHRQIVCFEVLMGLPRIFARIPCPGTSCNLLLKNRIDVGHTKSMNLISTLVQSMRDLDDANKLKFSQEITIAYTSLQACCCCCFNFLIF